MNQTFVAQAIASLQSHHYRCTQTRLWMIYTFADINHPVNAYDLLSGYSNGHIDITTIYRNLDVFESLGIIHKIHSLGGYMPCIHDHPHCSQTHDLVVCKSCNQIQETHLTLSIKQALGLQGSVECSGLCRSCFDRQTGTSE